MLKIRPAKPDDAALIATMLSCLAEHIGEAAVHRSTTETVMKFGFGEAAMFQTLIGQHAGEAAGLSLFFPVYSTTRAAPGVYVQDLWVNRSARGSGLGRALLAATAEFANAHWDARFLRLTAYGRNSSAVAFYRRLRFDDDERECPMFIADEAFDQLRTAT